MEPVERLRALWPALKARGVRQEDIAEQIRNKTSKKTSQTTVSAWLRDEKPTSPKGTRTQNAVEELVKEIERGEWPTQVQAATDTPVSSVPMGDPERLSLLARLSDLQKAVAMGPVGSSANEAQSGRLYRQGRVSMVRRSRRRADGGKSKAPAKQPGSQGPNEPGQTP